MPILYVNPVRRSRTRVRRVKPLRGVMLGRVKKASRRRVRKHGRKVAIVVRRKAASRRPIKRKGKRMARKLFGAAKKAHAKRMAKLHRKRNPHRRRRRRRNPGAVAAPAANPHRRKRRKARKARRHNPRRAHARRRRRNPAMSVPIAFAAPKRRRRRTHRKARTVVQRRAAARRRYHKRHPMAKRRYGTKAMRRARRSIKRAYRYGGRAGAYARRFKMRTNPRRRRHRRNPGLIGGTPGVLMSAVRTAVPIAASLYLTRILINKVGPKVPGLDKLGRAAKPALAALVVVGANYATKKGPLHKWRSGILIGTSLNLVDSLVSAFAPDSVKAMFGLGDSGMYDHAMGEFVTTSDYLEVGEPIDDDIALSDYVETSGIEEELGAIQEELGVEEELGALEAATGVGSSPRRLGGVSQSSMLKALKQSSAIGVVPTRSFTKRIPHAGQGYDNPSTLYAGIFGGGF